MSMPARNTAATDEELIGVLMAISVTSKRLAKKLVELNQASQSKEGKKNENEHQNRNGSNRIRVAHYCIIC